MSHSSFANSPHERAQAAAIPNGILLTKRTSGTNGWMSLWASNAHGEIAGRPPSAL